MVNFNTLVGRIYMGSFMDRVPLGSLSKCPLAMLKGAVTRLMHLGPKSSTVLLSSEESNVDLGKRRLCCKLVITGCSDECRKM